MITLNVGTSLRKIKVFIKIKENFIIKIIIILEIITNKGIKRTNKRISLIKIRNKKNSLKIDKK